MHSAIAYFAPGDPGYVLDVSGAAVLTSSQHQPEAQRFLAFLVSRQGQEIIAHSQSYEYPLGSGVTTAKRPPPFDTLQPRRSAWPSWATARRDRPAAAGAAPVTVGRAVTGHRLAGRVARPARRGRRRTGGAVHRRRPRLAGSPPAHVPWLVGGLLVPRPSSSSLLAGARRSVGASCRPCCSGTLTATLLWNTVRLVGGRHRPRRR